MKSEIARWRFPENGPVRRITEDAEAKPFWIEFFHVFGISPRRIGGFEQKVKKLGDRDGYIDWLWKGNLLIEHKSRGKDLDRAYQQAIDYFPGLKEHELPRFVLVSDFARFRLYDSIEGTQTEFLLKDFHKFVKLFWFIAGYQPQKISPQSPVNAKAVQRMAKLHDRLKQIGYGSDKPRDLEVYLWYWPAVLSVRRRYRYFRAHAVYRIHRAENARRRQRSGVAAFTIV